MTSQDRKNRFVWHDGDIVIIRQEDVIPIPTTETRTVTIEGMEFELALEQTATRVAWTARHNDADYASGIIENEELELAVKLIQWKLFGLIIQAREGV